MNALQVAFCLLVVGVYAYVYGVMRGRNDRIDAEERAPAAEPTDRVWLSDGAMDYPRPMSVTPPIPYEFLCHCASCEADRLIRDSGCRPPRTAGVEP